MKRLQPFILLLVFLCVAPVLAQGDCPALVEQALDAVDSLCQGTGRNQACYGNVSLDAEPQPGVEAFKFEQVGDVVDVADVQSMRLSPMDVASGLWGVALMRLQANLPDTLPGQNVTLVLFGDVEIQNVTEPDDEDLTPMQAFYLQTGIGDAGCAEAPESGLLVQTPEGVGEIALNVNGVDVQMGSTVFFQSPDEYEMQVAAIEGAAYLEKEGRRHVILAGTRARVPLLLLSAAPPTPTGGGSETPRPVLGEPYEEQAFQALPLRLLERKIEIHAPLSREQLERARRLLESGHAPCGEEPLPPCHELPSDAGGTPCVLLPRPGALLPRRDETRPLCEIQPEGAD